MKASPLIIGRGMAVAGLVTGYISTVIGLFVVGFFTLVIMTESDFDDYLDSETSDSYEEVSPADAEAYIILPEEHPVSEPIPTAIWLHGYGWNPSEISIFEEEYQERANDLGIAFVGVSAPQKLEEGSYQWAEELDVDSSYLVEVLDANSDKITPLWSKVVLFGFSQGAKVAGDVALNDPENYAGAILFSPGGHKIRPVTPDSSLPSHEGQRFFCFVGAEEAYGNVSLNRKYHDAFTEAGATSTLKEYPDMSEHSTPPDFDEKLGEWLGEILELSPAAESSGNPPEL